MFVGSNPMLLLKVEQTTSMVGSKREVWLVLWLNTWSGIQIG
jgi:hypothetical protein